MTEYSDVSGPADSPGDAGGGPGTANDVDAGALAVEDQLPARQEPDPAIDGDDPEYDYDEDDLAAEYDGDLEALTAEDRFPAGQESRPDAEGDDPEDDGADLTIEDDEAAGALAVEDQLPARQEPYATAGDDSEYDYDEDDLAAEYDGDLDALTAEDQTPGTGDDHVVDGAAGDQDQAVVEEELSATAGKPADLTAEASGVSAAAVPEQEDDNVVAPESPPAGATADTGSAAEVGAGERPDERPQAGQVDALTRQADDGHADPEAGLRELKAEYEASLKELKAELQALKERREATVDAPGDAGRDADQPRLNDRKLPVDQKNQKEVKPEGDRPGLWSNAKYALYGAVGTTAGMALLDQFVPGLSRVVEDLLVGVPTFVGALVPTLREGWMRKHDDSPNKL